ncbi:polynucleotide adenylyltransferase PcnB [Aliikangiella maris]|uniref:Poly(A) polymerase I n=2 Tax=Aliikangiella maris TaxID=3162458 RepID=A0ABV2BRG7_9GAMM
MISKLWQRLRGKKSEDFTGTPLVIPRDQHNVSRKNISKNALKVLYKLNDAGYEAYLVGGSVRDILLGLSPKDFDVATNATPEQICQVFKNSRLIGRRFKLAHVVFGREVIEVATFRGHHGDGDTQHAQTSNKGMLVRDNVYGSLEEDAFRRDFTVNALYYSAKDFTVFDHTGGLADLQKRQLKLIGDPQTRYQEDPVRILRAIRLSCKLNLTIEPLTAAPIQKSAEMLGQISPARLWDECNKLFLSGHAYSIWQQMLHFGVMKYLFYQTDQYLKGADAALFNQFIESSLKNTDTRIKQQQPVTPAFLFAVFLWQPLQKETQVQIKKGVHTYEASQKAAIKVVDKQRSTIAIPKRFSTVAKEIWSLQYRLPNRKKRNVDSLIQHPRFRAAYDFLCLRAAGDAKLQEIANWWTSFQEASAPDKHQLIKQVNEGHSRSHKRKKRQNNYSRRARNN